jgi:hypothetical protein
MDLSGPALSFDALSIMIGVLAVIGGTLSIKRRMWWLALTGAICAVFPPHPWGIETLTPLLGALAIALIVASKSEFAAA